MAKNIKNIVTFLILALLFISCGKTDFTKLADENKNKSFPSSGDGSPSGRDAVSSSTNWSHKADELSPKLSPLAGAAYIKPPEINNYGSVGLSYPVDVPPGRNGIQPGVGLSYSSSGGDGLLGIGWSLGTGLGVISRTTVNGQLYYDYRDIFTYNGKRLVKVAGPSGSENGTYRLEIEFGFSRFELEGAASGGVWRMYDKSGTITVFGEGLSSRIYVPTNNMKTYIWNFSRVYDLNGNFMEALYDTSDYSANHVLYLREIKYTGNYTESAPARQYVRFNYKGRGEAYVSKAPGFIMKMERLLDSIEVGWDGTRLWQYNMVYETSEDSGRPLLKTVDSTRTATSPEFIYQPAEHLFVWQLAANPSYNDPELNPDAVKYFEGDFNGDGLSDMVFFNPETGDWKAAEGRREGGYNFKTYGNKFKGYNNSSKIQFFKGNVTGDYNGDGRSDIAFYLPETKEFWVAEHNGRVFEFKRYGGLSLTGIDIMKCEWFTGDFDGNGLSDAVLFNEPTGEWILMRNMGGYFEFIKFSRHFKNLFRGDYAPDSNMDSQSTGDSSEYGKAREKVHFLSGDFNGDGRTDISIYDARDGKWWVAENYRDDALGFRLEWKLYKVFTAPEQALFGHDRFSGDFNGDGFSDFLLFDREKGEWVIGETGDGTIKFRAYSKIPGNLDVTRWLQGDFNGDGRTDIGFYSKTDNNFWIGEATPTGFRYRIYNNMSYGPDPARVMATPLPRDEVRIEEKTAVISGTTGTSIVKYRYDGNFHSMRGERVFPGNFTGDISNLLMPVYNRKDNLIYSMNTSGMLTSTAVTVDLESSDIKILNGGRPGRYRMNEGILYYKKSSGMFGSGGHDFHLIHYNNNSFTDEKIASVTEVTDFNIDESIYLVDDFNTVIGNKKEILALDDRAGTPGFMRFPDPSNHEIISISESGDLKPRDFRDLRDRRDSYRFFSGRFGDAVTDPTKPAEVLLVDMREAEHKWYLGSIENNTITFTALNGSPSFVSMGYSDMYRVLNDGSLVYSVLEDGRAGLKKIKINGNDITQTAYPLFADGITFNNEYDFNENPVIYAPEGIKIVKLGTSNYQVEPLVPKDPDVLSYDIKRNDLMALVYPFQWIQGDYNGDGKTDIGIFHLKEPKWYFAVTRGTVPDLMEKVKNGIGGNYEFEYANSTSFDNTGDDGIPHLPMNYKVCVKMTISDGQGWSTFNKYEYKKGHAFSGFINGKKETDYFGFGEFRAIDALGGRTISLYNNVPYSDFRMNRALAGAVKESRFIGWDMKEYSKTVNEYMVHVLTSPPALSGAFLTSVSAPDTKASVLVASLGGEGSVASYLVEPIKVEKYIKGVHTETRSSNIELVPGKYEMKSKSESVTDRYSDGVHTPVTLSGYSEYENIESTNEMRLKIKRNHAGTSHETQSIYEYDQRGNLTKETLSYSGTGLPSVSRRVTEHEYDGFGNRVKTINASGSPSRVTEKLFDSELHQFAVEERAHTDTGYLSTKYTINYGSAFGGISEKADPNGNLSYFDYDSYGRLAFQRAETENGMETINTYSYSTGFPMSARVVVNTGTNDPAIQTRSYADGLGRAIHTVRSAGDESGKRFTKTGLLKYDALGRVIRKSQTDWADDNEIDSFKPNYNEKYPTRTEYDGSGRVMKVTLPQAEGETEATSISYGYNDPWEVVESHSVGRSKRSVKNARGQVLYVEEWGTGDNGSSVSVKMGFAYDVAGNRVKKKDLTPGIPPGPPLIKGGDVSAGMSLEVPSSLFSPGQKDTSGSNIACWRYDAFGRVRESSDSDLGYRKNEYNEFGDLAFTMDAMGRITTLAYDRLGRMTLKTLPGIEGVVAYYYDSLSGSENALGKLVRIDDPAQRKDLSYDKFGRIKREVRVITGITTEFVARFEYDLLNRTKKIYYPRDPETNKALVSNYRYNQMGITGLEADTGSGVKNIVTGVKYNEFGQMAEISRGNGTTTIYDYDIKGRLYNLITTAEHNGKSWKVQDIKYKFKVDNSISGMENTSDVATDGAYDTSITYNYQYDGLNRLIRATGDYEKNRAGSMGIENISIKRFELGYEYSANGNLTEKKIYDPNTHGISDRWTYQYSNHAATKIDTMTGTRFVMNYDPAGNMIKQTDQVNNLTKNMVYDTNNRIHEVYDGNNKLIGKYDYDDGGFRVRKSSSRMIDGKERIMETISPSMYLTLEKQKKSNGNEIRGTSASASHIYVNGVRMAAVTHDGKAKYFLTDHVDSVTEVVDDYGMIVSSYQYLPFGEDWIHDGDKKLASKFGSQEKDVETGYVFMNFRHYVPEIGRFSKPDDIVDGNDTQGWNRYSYVKNNPVVYKDPTGHEGVGLYNYLSDGENRNTLYGTNIGKVNSEDAVAKDKVEWKLEKSKDDRIRPSSPLFQSDPSLNKANNQMKESGCYFRSLQAGVELKGVGKNLTADEINSSKKELQSGKKPPVRTDMFVQDPDPVVNDAFSKLGSNKTGTVGYGGKGKPDFTIIEGKTPQGLHYKTGDSEGKEIFDPGPNVNTEKNKIIPVYIHDRNEKK